MKKVKFGIVGTGAIAKMHTEAMRLTGKACLLRRPRNTRRLLDPIKELEEAKGLKEISWRLPGSESNPQRGH